MKIPIFTAIYGEYDALIQVKDTVMFQHILITDRMPKDPAGWKVIIRKNAGDNSIIQSRRVKFLGATTIFDISQSEINVYIDGSLKILDYELLFKICNGLLNNDSIDMVMPDSRNSNSVMMEAVQAIAFGKVDSAKVYDQLRNYKKHRFNESKTTVSAGFRVAKNNKSANEFLALWFKDWLKYQTRDQICFPYIAWSENYKRYKKLNLDIRNRLFKKMPHLYDNATI